MNDAESAAESETRHKYLLRTHTGGICKFGGGDCIHESGLVIFRNVFYVCITHVFYNTAENSVQCYKTPFCTAINTVNKTANSKNGNHVFNHAEKLTYRPYTNVRNATFTIFQLVLPSYFMSFRAKATIE